MSMVDRFSRHLNKHTDWAIPAAALVCVVSLQVSGLAWVELLQHRAFDVFQQLRPRAYSDAGVRIIDLDDESMSKLGQWPWPRTQVAKLERRLQQLGASATVYDIFFAEPDRTSPRRIAASWPGDPEFTALKERVSKLPDHDAILAKALKDGNAVLGYALFSERNESRPASKASFSFGGDGPLNYAIPMGGAVINLPLLEEASAGLGNVGFPAESDQVIRYVPLLFSLRGALFPSLSIEGLRVAQGASSYAIKSSGASGEGFAGQRTGIVALKVGEFVVPTDERGRLWVYYTKEAPGRTIPAWKLFEKDFDRAALEGSICLIGTSAAGLKDLRVTPLNPTAPGVEVHANIMEQIITKSFLARPDWAMGAEVVYLLTLGVLLLLVLTRAGAIWSGPVAAAAVASSLGLSWYAFTTWHWLLDPVLPTTGLIAVYASWSAVMFVRTEGDKRRITDTFGRYLSPKVVEKLAKNPDGVQLGGETREMTFHFCDIRGFTTISEKFDPHGLTVFINNFLTPMTEIILQHDGTIDKYMGDCIMAFWNAPMNVPNHARRACDAALKMHARLAELNAKWQDEAKAKGISLPKIEIGTGLNTGPCVVGNMGSTLRVDYTVLGDDVNLASRLEGQSKTYGVHVVLGPLTRQQAPEYAAVELDLIKVKGKTKPVNIYALLGSPEEAKTAPFLALEKKHAEFLTVYRSAKFEQAAKLMAEARTLGEPFHLGKLYDLYADRLESFKAEPPDKNWDGVFTATSK